MEDWSSVLWSDKSKLNMLGQIVSGMFVGDGELLIPNACVAPLSTVEET